MNTPLSILVAASLLASCATTSPLPGIPTTGSCGLEAVSVLALGME
jgi:hypothetical protein